MLRRLTEAAGLALMLAGAWLAHDWWEGDVRVVPVPPPPSVQEAPDTVGA